MEETAESRKVKVEEFDDEDDDSVVKEMDRINFIDWAIVLLESTDYCLFDLRRLFDN